MQCGLEDHSEHAAVLVVQRGHAVSLPTQGPNPAVKQYVSDCVASQGAGDTFCPPPEAELLLPDCSLPVMVTLMS